VKSPAILPALIVLLAACGGKGAPPAPPTADIHLLAADMPDAVGVLSAKASETGKEVTVYGRVRRTAPGLFTLVDDQAVRYCGQRDDPMGDCPTPWDYCCENQDKVTEATLVIEATDAAGKPVPKEQLGVRPLDLVAVRGTLKKDDTGVLVLEARSGWFRRERPKVSDKIQFP
jgi:hypothetical protein